MKLLHIFLGLTIVTVSVQCINNQKIFPLFHTPLVSAVGDFIDAAALYHYKIKHFEDTYYHTIFYVTAAGITLRNFYNNSYAINSLLTGSLKGGIGGILAMYCTWPFYPFVAVGARNYYQSCVQEKVELVHQLIDATHTLAILNATQKSLPTYIEGTWINEQKISIYIHITRRMQELQEYALQGKTHE